MLPDEQEWFDIAHFDWCIDADDESIAVLLHAPSDNLTYEDWSASGSVRCGESAPFWTIPGVFARMGSMRCGACCEAAGLPDGKGSPKNDADCRRLLGLAPSSPLEPLKGGG